MRLVKRKIYMEVGDRLIIDGNVMECVAGQECEKCELPKTHYNSAVCYYCDMMACLSCERHDGGVHFEFAKECEPVAQVVSGSTYRDIPLERIAEAWIKHTGGEPKVGGRVNRLYKLALRLGYLCGYDENTVYKSLPSCGLPTAVLKEIAASAMYSQHYSTMPDDLKEVIAELELLDSKQRNTSTTTTKEISK